MLFRSEAYQGPWRAHIAMWAAETALRRASGDFIECGVWLGFVSSLVMQYIGWNESHGQRRFFLVDSFEGLSGDMLTADEKSVGTHATFGERYVGTLERARQTMKGFNDVHFVKGFVPHILPSIPAKEVAYLHLDMNAAIPEVEALTFFWPKLVTGGVVLFDDYAYAGYRPQKIAIDQVAASFGVTVASLPTGQGLLIK